MKHLFTLIFLTVLFGTSSADQRQSSSVLNLQLYGRGDFAVKIDGVNYRWVDNQLQIGALSPGNHYIQVTEHFKTPAGRGGRGKQTISQRTVYNGNIHVPFSSIVWARYTANLGLKVDRIEPIVVQRYPAAGGQCRNLNGNCDDHNHDHKYDGRQGGGSDWYNEDDRNNGNRGGYNNGGQDGRDEHRGQGYGNNGSNGNGYGNFVALKDAVARASFDSDKLLIANQYIKSNSISASEVASVMGLLTYESNKLEFAKNAYSACYDKQNYFLVNQAFTYSSSIRQLNAFIK